MRERAIFKNVASAGLVTNPAATESLKSPSIHYVLECFDKCGDLKWVEEVGNLVTTAGKNDIVDKYFKGSAYTAAWFLGLKGTGAAVVGDTLASHAGWAEVTPYSGNRPGITFGTTSAGSNTATAVSFTINASATVAGAFIASVASGTAGLLYSAADFGTSRSVVSGDTLNVTPTVATS